MGKHIVCEAGPLAVVGERKNKQPPGKQQQQKYYMKNTFGSVGFLLINWDYSHDLNIGLKNKGSIIGSAVQWESKSQPFENWKHPKTSPLLE